MIGPSEVLSAIYTVGNFIYQKSDDAKANKLQCKRLSRRVGVILAAVHKLDQIKDIEQYLDGLLVLQRGLEVCLRFIEEFSAKKSWFKKVLNIGASKERFAELNDQLEKAVVDLNLGINAQQIFNREHDKEDQTKDYNAIREQQDEITKLNQEANQALQELKLEEKERHEILLKQLMSMRGKIAVLDVQKAEAKPQIEPHLMIPYYEIGFDSKLGAGAYCNVYLGQWCEQRVAIKALEGELEANDLEEFIREIKVMGRLHNPNIVQLYGACIEAKNPCLVMEYLEAGSLSGYLETKTFSAVEQKEVTLDISRGLFYLHKQGVLHRDLKSANVLLNAQKRAKLADFGLAKMKRICSVKSMKKHSEAIEWQAPECLQRNPVYTEASDIYSFGMILWEIVTGKKPYAHLKGDAHFAARVIEHVLAGKREDIPANMPQVYQEIIKACWETSPFKRPAIDDVMQQLKQYQPAITLSAEEHYQLGIQHETASRFNAAYDEYQLSAVGGFAKAFTNIGFFCLKGLGGLKQNASEAYQYFLQAAEKGHVRAMMNVAALLERGEGVAQNLAGAKSWYQKAWAAGEVKAEEPCQRLEKILKASLSTSSSSASMSQAT